jgi:hypothetical protein
MFRKPVTPLIVGVLLTGSPPLLWADPPKTGQTAPDVTASELLLTAAHQMIADFKITRYSHKTHIDRDRGVCEVDCSGFLVVLLKETSPRHLRQIATQHQRPLAEDFYAVFTAQNGERPSGWKPIKHLQDVEPGDVIAWLKQERQPGDNTGHVMLVEQKPAADGPNQFRVRVLDSTAHGHSGDTRPEGASGIGAGTLWLDVDGDGRPIGYRWKSRRGMLHQAPIAIGRAVGEPGVPTQ